MPYTIRNHGAQVAAAEGPLAGGFLPCVYIGIIVYIVISGNVVEEARGVNVEQDSGLRDRE